MNNVIRTVAPLAVIAVGVGAAALFVATQPTPERAEPEPVAVRVQAERIERSDRPVRISAMGTVLAARRVDLRPEVGGRVVDHHPDLIPGGRVRAEETLVRVDPRDYRLALEEARAALEKAKFDLSVEQGRQKIARREFELLRSDSKDLTEDEYALALRKPHLKNFEAGLEAAESRVRRARLDIARTSIEAPFNAIVQSESVDMGQLVNSQTTLATLVGTDAFWVRVSVPVSALEWIQPEDGGTAQVEVRHDQGRGDPIVKRGRVLRLLGDLDPKGRMARLLVRVEDPLDLEAPPAERRPLLLGAYVDVTISGRSAERVAVIPRVALREGGVVWLVDGDGRLEVRPVKTAFRGRDEVYVSSGLNEDDLLVTSRIAAPVPGTLLKIVTEVEGETPSKSTTASVDG